MRIPLIVLALWSAGSAPAQAPIGDDGASVVRIADDAYAIIHRDASTDWESGATAWPHGNTGVIIGPDYAIVIDATFLPARARADIALIRRLTSKPVRYLVNTHWHGDHVHGNAAYRDAFPGVVIVGSRVNHDHIATQQSRIAVRAKRPDGPMRVALSALEDVRARGRDSTGRAYSAAQLARIDTGIAQRRLELAGLAEVRVAAPDLLFERELVLRLGEREVVLRDWGPGNSPSDITVHLPGQRILFTGDLVVHPVPFAFGVHPLPWSRTLRALEALPVSALVPGHGPVLRDHGHTRLVRELLEAVTARVQAAVAAGAGPDETARQVDLDDFRARFIDGSANARVYWEGSVLGSLVPRAFSCVQGLGC